jgi:hypothetical protein
MGGVGLTKVQYTHSWDALRNCSERYFGLKNLRQDCKIGRMCVGGVLVGGGR